jgi:tetratricopeptide (TPR) repeat protein
MNIIPINVLVADRYLYLPSLGGALVEGALVWVVWRAGRRALAVVICVFLAAAGAAMTIERNGVWRDSFSLWSSVVEEFPESGEARLLVAAAYADLAEPDYDAALAEIDRAGDLMGDSPKPHVSRGRLLMRMGRRDEALAELEKARELGGDDSLAAYKSLLEKAGLLQGSGDLAGAVAAVREAMKIDNMRAEGPYKLGVLLEASLDASGAVAAYGKALERDPRHALSLYNLGRLTARAGDEPAAAVYYRRAIEAEPAFAEAMVNLASLERAAGNEAEAERLLRRAAEVAENPLTRVRALGALGEYTAAKDAVEGLLKEDPSNREALAILEQLNRLMQGE